MIPEKFPKFNALFGIDDIAAGLIIGGVGGSLISAFGGSSAQRSSDARNAALQREFAQNRIQWTTKDARAAGIHPLAAIGAPTTSAQPSYIGSGRHWEQMGQNISRMATNLALQKQKAEIAKLGAETTMIRSATVPSSPPAGAVQPIQSMQKDGNVKQGGFGGSMPMWQHAMGAGNMYAQVVPNSELSEVFESSWIDKQMNNIQRLYETRPGAHYDLYKPPSRYLRPGHVWKATSPFMWRQVKSSDQMWKSHGYQAPKRYYKIPKSDIRPIPKTPPNYPAPRKYY